MIIKIHIALFFKRSWIFCGVYETNRDEDSHSYWPITFSLDHAVLSSRPHLALLLLLGHVLIRKPAEGRCSRGAPSHKLRLPVSHMDICIYNFLTPKHFYSTTWLPLLIFTGASCAENLWLTAQSRVNMQHYEK